MESELKKAVLEVYRTTEGLKFKIVLIGALISEVSHEMGPDYPKFRKTNDADFAVYVPTWDAFHNLRAKLIELKFKQDKKTEHRLLRDHVVVDLIPYGEGIAPGGRALWPESEFEMNVIGFKEVCDAATKSVKEGGPEVPIITIPGFVLLKIIAFLDRRARLDLKYKSDAGDIHYWLENYASGNNDERRFGVKARVGSEFEHEMAGAALLGLDVGHLASKEAGEIVDKFLAQSGDLYAPFMDVIVAKALDEEQGMQKRREALNLIKAFEAGYRRACG